MTLRTLVVLLSSFSLALGVAACGDSGGDGTGTDTSSEPGDETGTEPGDETGTEPGDETGTEPGDETGGVDIDWAAAPELPHHDPIEPEIVENDASCVGGLKMTNITGKILDAAGNPLVDSKAQACIRKASDQTPGCLQPQSPGADGVFDIGVPQDGHSCAEAVSMRLLVPTQNFTTNYCNVDLVTDGGTVLDLGDEPFVLHETIAANPSEDGDSNDTDSIVTVGFEDGFEVDVPVYYTFGEKPEGLVWLDGADMQCLPDYLAGAPGFYGFNPEIDVWAAGDGSSGLMDARIPAGDLADGTWVALYLLGGIGCTDTAGDHYHEGVWEPFTVAPVQDGTIWAIGEAGLPCFTWLTWLPVE